MVEVVLPDRFEDGYGMSTKIVQKTEELGVSLVITVDCGSSNGDVIDLLNKKGINTVITDHHELLHGVPNAVAVINPKRKDIDVSTKITQLAGVGVAFEVARALAEKGLIKAGQEKWLLDLVVVGTVADRMVMRGENWKMGYFGLKVLQKTRRIGLRKLFKIANIRGVDSEVIGFGIAPRLNAAGRMESAKMAMDLLLTKNELEAKYLASELDKLNTERKAEQKKAMNEMIIGDDPVIVTYGDCHEGVIGIVAGRILEKYKKPTFVFTNTTDSEQIKCSGRSFGDYNLGEALKYVGELLIKGGGHAGACGATIYKRDLDKFKEGVNKYYTQLKLSDQEKFLEKQADMEIFDEDITVELVDRIGRLEPFGPENEKPIFIKKCVQVKDFRLMGSEKNHLSFMVNGVKMVWFFAPQEWLNISDGECVDIKFTLGVDEWGGVKRVNGMLVDMKYYKGDNR